MPIQLSTGMSEIGTDAAKMLGLTQEALADALVLSGRLAARTGPGAPAKPGGSSARRGPLLHPLFAFST
jgi:hypothetical protein